jgi:secreted PhoX family phosphatase
MTLSRRQLLGRGAAGLGIVALGNASSLFDAVGASPVRRDGWNGRGWHGPRSWQEVGPLLDDPAGMLDLPAGFSYRVVSRAGDAMPGGGTVPSNQDGTGSFAAPGGRTVLVVNHELGSSATLPATAATALTYDPGAKGGTTTLTLDRRGNRVDEYVSLAGTYSNCAGGLTPWGTWLTCEETETKAGAGGGAITRDHGWVFEVDPLRPANNAVPTPLTAMGRFAHEAACVDPQRGHVYLTEDASNPNGLVFRFTPNDRRPRYGALRAGGALEAMRCRDGGTHVPDLSVYTEPGTELSVSWTTVPDRLAATTSIRKQLANDQVTRSRKFEGAWWGNGRAFIVCSYARLSDGSAAEHDGQVWSYDPKQGRLRLEVRFAVNTDTASDAPDGPDNITVSPYGGLFLAEDGEGVQHLFGVTPDGESYPFARNALNDSEFTGVNFAPDAATMFANIQDPGITLAITGPFSGLCRRH